MMKKYLLLLIALFSFFGCDRRQPEEHVIYARQEINKFQRHAREKYGLLMFGYGGGFMHQINEFDLSFYLPNELSFDEMRELIINLTEDFQDQINSNAEIQQFLAESPFPTNRLLFRVTIIDKKGKPIENSGKQTDRITSVWIKGDKIGYSILNEDKPYYQIVHKEDYEEAKEKLKNQN